MNTGTPQNNWLLPFGQPEWVLAEHNRYAGKRCFIFGTGPSLRQQLPLLHRLDGECIWTVNKMRWWQEFPLIPTFHCVAEPGTLGVRAKSVFPEFDFPTAEVKIAIHWEPVKVTGWRWVAKAPDSVQVRYNGFFGLDDFLPPLPTAYASPLTSAQFAAWMGFSEFYFLGVDNTQDGEAWDPIWGRPRTRRNLSAVVQCFAAARVALERAGRKVYDCTPGGNISKEGALPYLPLEELLGLSVRI